jgi:demethylmenaquinone methyltransferase/2-methoxy-6-polyprenyl-1,4-benzoquinol methylase
MGTVRVVEKAVKKTWDLEGDQKSARVRDMFAEIAPTYDLLNSTMSFRLHHRWRAAAVRGMRLRPGDIVADVCCGTGDFGKALRAAVGKSGAIVGIDYCAPMLEIAARKPYELGLTLGDAGRMPLESGSVDGVTIGWGLRNVPDLRLALSEVFRVLRRGGSFATVDMARPKGAIARTAAGLMFHKGIPLLGSLFGKRDAYTYLPKSTQRFASRDELSALMRSAGFGNIRCEDHFFGNICIHWGEK